MIIYLEKNITYQAHSAVGRDSDWRSRGREFDLGPVPYFCGDRSWNNFYGHSPLSTHSRRAVVSYKRKYVQEVWVNCLVKLAQEKSMVRWTAHPDMTIDVDWDVKHQNKQKKQMMYICQKYCAFNALVAINSILY